MIALKKTITYAAGFAAVMAFALLVLNQAYQGAGGRQFWQADFIGAALLVFAIAITAIYLLLRAAISNAKSCRL